MTNRTAIQITPMAIGLLAVALLAFWQVLASPVDASHGGIHTETNTPSPVPATNTPSPIPPTNTPSPVPPTDTPPPTATLTPAPIGVSSTTQTVTGLFGSLDLPGGNFNASIVFQPALADDSYNLQTTAIGATCGVTEKTAAGFTVACIGAGTLDWAALMTRGSGRGGRP